jgi:hypothetical protein
MRRIESSWGLCAGGVSCSKVVGASRSIYAHSKTKPKIDSGHRRTGRINQQVQFLQIQEHV